MRCKGSAFILPLQTFPKFFLEKLHFIFSAVPMAVSTPYYIISTVLTAARRVVVVAGGVRKQKTAIRKLRMAV